MEAPLVCLDEEFDDLRPCRIDDLDHPALNHSPYSTTTTTVPLAPITREDFSELENFSEMMSFKSMEDLVNEFDEKLNVCFHNYNTKTEGLAPIRNQSHNQEDEERLQDEEWVTTVTVTWVDRMLATMITSLKYLSHQSVIWILKTAHKCTANVWWISLFSHWVTAVTNNKIRACCVITKQNK